MVLEHFYICRFIGTIIKRINTANGVLVEPLGSSLCKWSAQRWFFFLLSYLEAFHFLFLVEFLWLGLPVLWCIEMVRGSFIVLFLILEDQCPTFHHWVCYIGLSHLACIVLKYFPSTPHLLRIIIMKGCCIWSNSFSISYEHLIILVICS